MTTESADYCMLVNEWAWLRSQVCLLRLEVDLGSVLESELGQNRRYGALKACIYRLKLVSSEEIQGLKGSNLYRAIANSCFKYLLNTEATRLIQMQCL